MDQGYTFRFWGGDLIKLLANQFRVGPTGVQLIFHSYIAESCEMFSFVNDYERKTKRCNTAIIK